MSQLTPEQQFNLKTTITQMDAVSSVMATIGSICFDKCISKYTSSELQIGELSCIDRCSIKYLETVEKINEVAMKGMQAGAGPLVPPQ